MMDMPLDSGITVDPANIAAANGVLEAAAARLHATPADLDRVRAALFGHTDDVDIDLAGLRDADSPADREIIRRLLTEGWPVAKIAAHVGCSIQVVAGIKGVATRHENQQARQAANA